MDDDEEMAALRASSRYAGSLKEVKEVSETEGSNNEAMRSFFPDSFGGPKAKKNMGFSFGSMSMPKPAQSKMSIAQIGRRGAPQKTTRRNADEEEAMPIPMSLPEESAPSTARPSSRDRHPAAAASKPGAATHETPAARSDVHPTIVTTGLAGVGDAGLHAEGSDSESESNNPMQYHPITREVVIPAYEKTVTAMAVDKHGMNLVTGSIDGVVKYWDFNGMNRSMKHYREFVPQEDHTVLALDFNARGNMILCITSDVHCRVYDREGSSAPIEITALGDMYVRDMAITKGHTKMLTDGMWHPCDAERWLSSSMDGTLRLWSLQGKRVGMESRLSQEHVLKTVDKRGVPMGATGKSALGLEGVYPTCCRYSPDGKKMVAGCSDGSIQIFYEKARYVKPDKIIRDGHSAEVTSVHLFAERMLSRSMDGTMKLWELKKDFMNPKAPPLRVWDNLPTDCIQTSCHVCPDNEYAVTGTCDKKSSNVLKLFSISTGDEVGSSPLTAGASRLHWSSQINQILIGDVKGGVTVKYNPKSSREGAMCFLAKEDVRNMKTIVDNEICSAKIIVPHDDRDALKEHGIMMRRDGTMREMKRGERKREQNKKFQKTKEPPRPGAFNPDEQGDDAVVQKLTTRAYLERFGKNEATAVDSQKHLLQYNDDGKLDDEYMFRAYKESQPDKMLDYSDRDMTDGDRLLQGRHCPKCGKKLCSCGFLANEEEKRQVKEDRIQKQQANEERRAAMEDMAKRRRTG